MPCIQYGIPAYQAIHRILTWKKLMNALVSQSWIEAFLLYYICSSRSLFFLSGPCVLLDVLPAFFSGIRKMCNLATTGFSLWPDLYIFFSLNSMCLGGMQPEDLKKGPHGVLWILIVCISTFIWVSWGLCSLWLMGPSHCYSQRCHSWVAPWQNHIV